MAALVLSRSPVKFEWKWRLPMSYGEDDVDQPPQGEMQRQRSRSRERVYPRVQVPQESQLQPMVTPESDDEMSDEDFAIIIPHHHQLDYQHELNKGIAPEDSKDPGHVSDYIHVHPRMLVNNNSLLCFLLQEFTRMQPWVHRIMCATIQDHHKIKKTHGDKVHKNPQDKYCRKAAEYNTKGQEVQALWIQMKTMENLKMSLEPLRSLRLLYQYYLFIQDQQPVRKDQLQMLILVMKTLSFAMSTVQTIRTLEEQFSIQISTFQQKMSIGQRRLKHTSMLKQLDHFAL